MRIVALSVLLLLLLISKCAFANGEKSGCCQIPLSGETILKIQKLVNESPEVSNELIKEIGGIIFGDLGSHVRIPIERLSEISQVMGEELVRNILKIRVPENNDDTEKPSP